MCLYTNNYFYWAKFAGVISKHNRGPVFSETQCNHWCSIVIIIYSILSTFCVNLSDILIKSRNLEFRNTTNLVQATSSAVHQLSNHEGKQEISSRRECVRSVHDWPQTPTLQRLLRLLMMWLLTSRCGCWCCGSSHEHPHTLSHSPKLLAFLLLLYNIKTRCHAIAGRTARCAL